MAKVVTNAGTEDFKAPPKEVKQEPAKLEVKEVAKPAELSEAKAEKPPEPTDEGIEADDVDLTEHVRKKINKKHRQMKEAQEAAADAEAFAKTQFDERRLVESENDRLKRELHEFKSKAAPIPKEPELKEPEIKDYTDDKGQVRWTDYTKDQANFAAAKAVADFKAQQAQERDKEAEAQARAAFTARLSKATEKYSDFMEVVGKSETMLPNAVLQYITESEYGPDVSYYMATHPETAIRISKLPPIKAIAEVGKLELTFEKPATKSEPESKPAERGGAPPPITPLSGSGSGTVQTDPSKMSFRELREYERLKRQKR